jgi:sulfite exporter TauE/SafE
MLISVLLASLLGSTHCAGMCGAFVMLAMHDPAARPISTGLLQSCYHLGRLATYTLLGSIAGIIGRTLDLGGEQAGLVGAAAIISAVVLMFIGISLLLKAAGVATPSLPIPGAWRRFIEARYSNALALPPLLRAGAIGTLTTLLPCGWLYTYIITAAGSGDPLTGSLIMFVFWLGTLPMLAAAAFSIRRVTTWLGPKAPIATAVLMIFVGALTVTARLATTTANTHESAPHPTLCVPITTLESMP